MIENSKGSMLGCLSVIGYLLIGCLVAGVVTRLYPEITDTEIVFIIILWPFTIIIGLLCSVAKGLAYAAVIIRWLFAK